jgi:WD40 repeat protein
LDTTNGEGDASEAGIEVADGSYYLSTDGAYLAYLGDSDQIIIEDLNSGDTSTIDIPSTTVTRIDAAGASTSGEEPGQIDSLAFSPDGERLAGGMCSERRISIDPETQQESDNCLQNVILLWEVTSGALQKRLPTDQPSAILSLAFNPQNGDNLASGYGDATIQFWDLAQDQAVGFPLVGMGGPVISLAFNQDGSILTSGSENNLIAMWNVNPPQLIGDPLVGSEGSLTGLTLGIDQSILYSASESGDILAWDLEKWKELACELAGRNLSESEWDQFFPPDEPYRATCLQYPLETPTAPQTPTPTATPTPTPSP